MSAFTKILDKIRSELADHFGIVEPVLATLEVVQAATGIGGQSAATALKVIDSALEALASHQDGVLSHDELVQRLADLKAEATSQIQEIESAQDVALSAKLPPDEPQP